MGECDRFVSAYRAARDCFDDAAACAPDRIAAVEASLCAYRETVEALTGVDTRAFEARQDALLASSGALLNAAERMGCDPRNLVFNARWSAWTAAYTIATACAPQSHISRK